MAVPEGSGVGNEADGAAHRLSGEQAEKLRLEPSEFQEVAEDLTAKAEPVTDAVRKLEAAGMRARGALEEDERNEREGVETDWRGQLLQPAHQLLSGLDDLLADERLWERLQASEKATGELDRSQKLVLYEVLDLNLDGLLEAMHMDPGRAKQLADGLRTALDDLVEETPDEARRAVRTRSAQQHIAYVTHHLRRAIDDAKAKGIDVDGGLRSSSPHPEPLRTRLRAAMRATAQVAVPAALAAGAVSLFAPAGHTAPIAGGVAGGVAAKELLKQAVQFGATGLMGRIPGAVRASTTATERFQSAKTRVDTALSEYGARLSNSKDAPDPSRERLTEALRIKSISAVYGFLQAQLDYAPTGHDRAREVTNPILDFLLEPGNLIAAQELETQHQKLREFLSRT